MRMMLDMLIKKGDYVFVGGIDFRVAKWRMEIDYVRVYQ